MSRNRLSAKVFQSYSTELLSVTKENNLTVTCGADYHDDMLYRANCGIYLPDTSQTIQDITEYLLTTDCIRMRVQEINDSSPNELSI